MCYAFRLSRLQFRGGKVTEKEEKITHPAVRDCAPIVTHKMNFAPFFNIADCADVAKVRLGFGAMRLTGEGIDCAGFVGRRI